MDYANIINMIESFDPQKIDIDHIENIDISVIDSIDKFNFGQSIEYNYPSYIKHKNSIILPLTYFKHPYNKYRVSKLLLFSDILNIERKHSDRDILNITIDIENSCYLATCKQLEELNQSIEWNSKYMQNTYNYICGNIAQNLDPQSSISSNYLLDKIYTKNIDLSRIAFMTSEELCPEKTIDLRANLAQRNDITYSTKLSTMFKCGKCKRNECSLDRRHTRGLDEGTNYRATCMFCKHTWNI